MAARLAPLDQLRRSSRRRPGTLPSSTSRASPPTTLRRACRSHPASGIGTGRSARRPDGEATPRIRGGSTPAQDARGPPSGRLVPDAPAFREDSGRSATGSRQRPADDLFGVAEAVDRRGVDPVDAQRDGAPHRGDGLRVVLRTPPEGPVAAAGGPRAEPDGRDLQAARAERPPAQCHAPASRLYLLRIDSRAHRPVALGP